MIDPMEIASLIRELNVDGHLNDNNLPEVTRRFADLLRADNPDFDYDKFYFHAVES